MNGKLKLFDKKSVEIFKKVFGFHPLRFIGPLESLIFNKQILNIVAFDIWLLKQGKYIEGKNSLKGYLESLGFGISEAVQELAGLKRNIKP